MSTSDANASAALSLMKDWANWMVALQTAALAAMGLIIKTDTGFVVLSNWQQGLGLLAAVFFGASTLLTTWVIGALPSIQQRITHKDDPRNGIDGPRNDIYEQDVYSILPVKLGELLALMHLYAFLGFALFAWFVGAIIMDPPS